MPNYRYRAINSAGRTLRGSLSAVNETDLYYRLKAAGLDLVDASKIRESKIAAYFAPSIQNRDLIELFLHLEQFEKVGVPILDALGDVREATESVRLRDTLTDVARDVSNGALFSEALNKHQKVFSKVIVGLISAGEKTGKMGDAFAHLVKHLKWADDMNRRVKKAVSYPSMLLVIAIAIISFMLMFVVPQLSDFLRSVGLSLPPMTLFMIQASQFMQDHYLLLFSTPIILWFVCRLAYVNNDRVAYEIDLWMYRVPIIGSVARKISLSRFCHFFAIMFQSGIGVLDCIKAARKLVANRALASSIDLVHDMVESGTTLTDAMRNSGEFPSLIVRMVKIGEDTGNLKETLDTISYFYDRDVEESINGMISALQPILTIVIGGIMLWIIVAVFFPVYNSFGSAPL